MRQWTKKKFNIKSIPDFKEDFAGFKIWLKKQNLDKTTKLALWLWHDIALCGDRLEGMTWKDWLNTAEAIIETVGFSID